MNSEMKAGDCYFNPRLVPFKVIAFVSNVVPIEGDAFAGVVVEHVWASEEFMPTIEMVPRVVVEGWVAHEETRKVSNTDLRCLRKHPDLPLRLSDTERDAVEYLWFIYGNGGSKYTKGNHEFLKCHLEGTPEKAGHYQPTQECIDSFKRILDEDYAMLPEQARNELKEKQKLDEWLKREK